MAHNAPSASEKEKTARLIASLSSKEQAELLAQALLREFMHRRGLHETLKAFDTENPRDARTISSRALMRQLLNIPVEGRSSRLQPTTTTAAVTAAAPSSSSSSPAAGKAVPPTFMEELCSYRLTKRGYTKPAIRLGDEPTASEADPSDVELEALRTAVEAHRTDKAICEQRQRRYEDMLAEEEDYQRRKEAHKLRRKKKSKQKKKRRSQEDGSKSSGGRKRQGGTAESEEDDTDNNTHTSSDDDDDDGDSGSEEQRHHRHRHSDRQLKSNKLVMGITDRRLSASLSLTPEGGRSQRRTSSADTSLLSAPSTGWQPPGLSPASFVAAADSEDGEADLFARHGGDAAHSRHGANVKASDSKHRRHHHRSNSNSSSGRGEGVRETTQKGHDGGADDDDDGSSSRSSSSSVDPFGSAAASQQALVARVRAESRRWSGGNLNAAALAGGGGGDAAVLSNHSTPKKSSAPSANQPSPLAALTNVPRGLAMAAGDGAALRPLSGGGPPGATLGALAGLGPAPNSSGVGGGGGGGMGTSGFYGGRLSTAPAGYNSAAAAAAPSSVLPTSESVAAGGSREGSVASEGFGGSPYGHGFPPPPASAMGSSILVKHTEASRREGPSAPTSIVAVGGNRVAAGRDGGGYDVRSPSPLANSPAPSGNSSGGGDDASFSASAGAGGVGGGGGWSSSTGSGMHTPSRSANNSGSGLRHGIGFRTSVSAEGTQSSTAAAATAAEGAEGSGGRPSRKQRRVKLLIDE